MNASGKAALLILAALLALPGCFSKGAVTTPRRPASKPPVHSKRPASQAVPRPGTAFEKPHYNHIEPAKAMRACARLDPRTQAMNSWTALRGPLLENLDYVARQPQDQPTTTLISPAPTWGRLRVTIERLLEMLPALDRDPKLLCRHFSWYALKPRPLMTGYYAPEIEVSLIPAPGYPHPIYAEPDNPALKASSRLNIDTHGALYGRDLEIAWARSLFDVYNLQVQGGGTAVLPDGSTRTILYSGSNGRPFTPVSHVLRDMGYLHPNKLGSDSVRRFFQENPSLARPLIAQNENYIYFALAEEGPLGSMGSPLTPMVSVAVDPAVAPLGSILALFSQLPAVNGRPPQVTGIVLAQDKGSAINGAELDFFTGHGEEAKQMACKLKYRAYTYLLLAK